MVRWTMCLLMMISDQVLILNELCSYIEFVSDCLTDGVRDLDLDF